MWSTAFYEGCSWRLSCEPTIGTSRAVGVQTSRCRLSFSLLVLRINHMGYKCMARLLPDGACHFQDKIEAEADRPT